MLSPSLLTLALLFGADSDLPKELAPLQGTWILADIPLGRLVVEGRTAKAYRAFGDNSERPFDGIEEPVTLELEVNEGKEFTEIDLIGWPNRLTPAGWKEKGVKGVARQFGIFKRNADELTIAFGTERPESFDAPEGVFVARLKHLNAPVAKEFAALQGVWRVTIFPREVKPRTAHVHLAILPGGYFADERSMGPLGLSSTVGSFSLDPESRPRSIDVNALLSVAPNLPVAESTSSRGTTSNFSSHRLLGKKGVRNHSTGSSPTISS